MRLHRLAILIVVVLTFASLPNSQSTDAEPSQLPAQSKPTPVGRLKPRTQRPFPPDPLGPKKQLDLPDNTYYPQPQMPHVTADKQLIQLGELVNFYVDPGDTRYSLIFDFDEDKFPPEIWSRDKPPPRFRFTQDKIYTVKVRLMPPAGVPTVNGEIATIPIDVRRVSLDPQPATVQVGLPVKLMAHSVSKDSNLRFRFTFGDGDRSDWLSDGETTHTYKSPGVYPRMVEVGFQTEAGTDPSDATAPKLISVELPDAGEVEFNVIPTQISPNQDVKFSVSFPANGRRLKYQFVFDPGETSGWLDDPQASHTYASGDHDTYVMVGMWVDGEVQLLAKKGPTSVTVLGTAPRPQSQTTRDPAPGPPRDGKGDSDPGIKDWWPWVLIAILGGAVVGTVGGVGGYKATKWLYPPSPEFVPSLKIGSTELDHQGAASLANFELHVDPGLSGGVYEVTTSEPKLIRVERSKP